MIEEVITDCELVEAGADAFSDGVERSADYLRLALSDILLKKSCGYAVSYTEGIFFNHFSLLRKDGSINKKGRHFLLDLHSASSNKKPKSTRIANKYKD